MLLLLFLCFVKHEGEIARHTIAVIQKEDEAMNTQANKSIECTVNQCVHHCDLENYCSLNKIKVGTHECNPTMDQCTDCLSFAKK